MASNSNSNSTKPPTLSKRQRRALGSNPSTTWQQQPRIKSAGARNRAYISYAGLNDEEEGRKKVSAHATTTTTTTTTATTATATVVTSEARRKAHEELLDPKLDLHSPEVKFGRLLGGTDQRSRHGAVKMLREYLRARSDISSGEGLSELDLLKLWKGLWYTLYMADKVPVQDKLSKILAELMWCLAGTEEEDEYAGQVYMQMDDDGLYDDGNEEEDGTSCGMIYEDEDGDTMQIIEMDDEEEEEDSDEEEEGGTDGEDPMEEEEYAEEGEEMEQRIKDINEKHCRGAHLVALYISTFLTTVRREWGNVDKHRVDKFYTAVRYMVSEAYKYMSKRHWNIGIIRLFNDVLYAEGLASDTPNLTNGLRYHLIDICVDELAKVNKDAELPLTEATILDCLEPFFAVAQKAEDKLVQKRVMDNVLLKFLNEYSFVSAVALASVEEGEIDEEDKALLFNQVHVGTVSKFVFEIASDENTEERYRKSLYEMHKTYVRQTRLAGRDVDLDAVDGEGDEEDCSESANLDVAEEEDDVIAIDEEAPVAEEEPEPVESSKKKKRKKKKNKSADKGSSKDEEAEDTVETSKAVAAAEDEDAPVAEEDPEPVESSKKKKRKKKKNKSADKESSKDEEAEDTVETPKAVAAAEDEDLSTPKKKSSKKKRKKQESESKADGDDEPAAEAELVNHTPKSKKKKQKTVSPPSVDPRSMQSPDQVIFSDDDDDDAQSYSGVESSASKRVSFGKMNHCKSHKASMKAMKTLRKDRWNTAVRTPDKSILRAKEESAAAMASSSTKKSKKKSSEKKKKGKPPLGPGSKKKKGKKSDTTSHVERY